MTRGFTLVELLVAIALLAIVSLLAYRGLDGMLRAQARTEAEAARWQAVALFLDRLRFDMQQPSARPVRRGPREEPAWYVAPSPAGRQETEIRFTRRPFGDGQDEKRLGYRLHDGRIDLLIWPVLDARDGAGALPATYTLLEGVRGFELRYLSTANRWQDDWPVAPGSADLPRAVSVRLTMADGIDVTRVFALP